MAEYLQPLGSVAYEGIDVSEYQGNIDFSQVRAAGKRAVYIRASLGSAYIDPYFERNYSNARRGCWWAFIILSQPAPRLRPGSRPGSSGIISGARP